jgi:hypothetical protein
MEISKAVLKEVKRTTTQPSNPKEWNQDLKELCVPHVHWSTIYNSQDTEATHRFISEWAYKDIMKHTYNTVLFSLKKRKSCYLQQYRWTWGTLCEAK